MSPKSVCGITAPLLSWYAAHRRPLPWREAVHPYTTWVSEIMAQQTRIAQLLPYYARFMARFPTVEALAAADLDAVLAAWAGLGYYTRARNLHKAAQAIARDGFPQDAAGWLALPGVGAYTAGAIAAMAYGEKVTAIDGNALRVYARLANDATDIKTPAAKKSAALFFETHMPQARADMQIYNQAIMELGALVCVPGRPLCEACPLRPVCMAHKHETARHLPVSPPKKPSPVMDMTVMMVINPGGQVLTQKRGQGLLKGMSVYCLAEGVVDPVSYASQLGLDALSCDWIGAAKHVFTHRVWQMQGYAVYTADAPAPEGYSFMSKAQIKTAPFPAAVKYFTRWYMAL